MPIDLAALFTNDTPLLDVRAPVEFSQGAFPTATNLPILDDNEREQIGICYRNKGANAAVALGHELVSGDVKRARIDAWLEFIKSNPKAHLYCFRGGQRSQIASQWLKDEGVEIPRIEGGYKALRRYLSSRFEALPHLAVIGGKTGVGKTMVLKQLGDARFDVIDLEGLANHRGSAFGKRIGGQPAQISFENALAIDLLKSGPLVFLEDESRMIGRINLPLPLQEAMKSAPLLVVEDAIANRVARIRDEYIVQLRDELTAAVGDAESALAAHRAMFLDAVDAIQKRLGGANHRTLRRQIDAAFDDERNAGPHVHDTWIEAMLVNYYDPMYEYQLQQKLERIDTRGDANAVLERANALLCQR